MTGRHGNKGVVSKIFKDSQSYPTDGNIQLMCDNTCVVDSATLCSCNAVLIIVSRIGQIDQVVVLNIDAGDSVKKDDLIAVLHKYPQPFVVKAPFDGVITDINDTAISITSEVNASGFIDTTKCNTVKIENSRFTLSVALIGFLRDASLAVPFSYILILLIISPGALYVKPFNGSGRILRPYLLLTEISNLCAITLV